MTKLSEIPGISSDFGVRLQEAGIATVEMLLAACVRAKGRYLLSQRTGIPRVTILGWANKASLLRIEGIGAENASLLEEAGVDSVPELSRCNAAELCKRVKEIHEAQSLASSAPSEEEISDWIEQAKRQPRILQH
jgi:predicted flap endonuclease-1-like 5' DNA nuclease